MIASSNQRWKMLEIQICHYRFPSNNNNSLIQICNGNLKRIIEPLSVKEILLFRGPIGVGIMFSISDWIRRSVSLTLYLMCAKTI